MGILKWYDDFDRFFYPNMSGVLQQLVNCFLEASWRSLTFRHILVISSKISVCQDLKDSLGDRLYIILHSRVCWNSSSTASWRHLEGKSWIVPKKVFCHTNIIQLVRKNWLSTNMMGAMPQKVRWSSLSTASWRQLEDVLLSYICT